jgi:hypothetical protein
LAIGFHKLTFPAQVNHKAFEPSLKVNMKNRNKVENDSYKRLPQTQSSGIMLIAGLQDQFSSAFAGCQEESQVAADRD